MAFAHLHVKSQYTLLGALGSPKELVARAKALGMANLALTDEMNLFGGVEFWKDCKEAGIHPVIGAELIIAPGSILEKNKVRENTRLVALVTNKDGYKSLSYLLSAGYLQGRHYVPRVDKALLAAHHQGLIVLSGDLRGEVPRLLGRGRFEEARAAAIGLQDLFGAGNFYLELMDLGWGSVPGSGLADEPDQRKVNDGLRQLSRETGIPLVVTNNAHYEKASDSFAHEILLAIGMQQTLSDVGRFRFPSDQFYLKSEEEMAHLFPDDQEARDNSVRIAERCQFKFETGTYRFPVYPRLEGRSPDDGLVEVAKKGLERRFDRFKACWPEEKLADWPLWEKKYRDRLEMELGVIGQMKFAAYFLIVYDFIHWAKAQDIPVGPGRGSGAGSLCLYSLRITDIDPIPYNLLFERFLNPERISMPDVDVDFCQDRRGEVIQYVNDAYGGQTRVSQIITYGKMLAKGVLRDVARVMGLTPQEADRIAKLIPEQLGITLVEAEEKEPKFKAVLDEEPRLRRLVGIARILEGTTRHCSVHAAGVVLADADLRDYAPLYQGAADGDPVVTQFDMKWAETIGLIKFDFLGLKTITQVKHALDMARAAGKTDYDFFSFNDILARDGANPKVFALLSRGDALGIFQLESSGMRELLRSMKPTSFEDIVAVAALYRPGPMGAGMHVTFVECKHGRQAVKYPHPSLVPVLKDTYGVIVYQEQVMQIAQVMGGYSLGEADLLRRAMGKKNAEEMAKQRDRFLRGTRERSIDDRQANEVFDLMARFAEYGFNKSHTAAYGLIAYQTAWLKAHLPAEFYASLLTIESGNTDKVLLYLDDARRHGIDVLPPDVNESDRKFAVVQGKVRFGLGGVKNVGESAIESILEARTKDGPFKDVGDFLTRVDLRRVNKRVIEALVRCGAFDGMGVTRAAMTESLDRLVEYGQNRAREKESGQFGLFATTPKAAGGLKIPQIPEWDEAERLRVEKEAMGFYVSGHPMGAFAAEIKRFTTATTADLRERKKGDTVELAGLVASIKVIRTKANQEEMAFVQWEDMVGSVEVTVFPKTYALVQAKLQLQEPLLLKATVDEVNEDGAKLIAEELRVLSEVREKETREVRFVLEAEELNDAHLKALKEVLARHPGKSTTKVQVPVRADVEVVVALPDAYKVRPSREMVLEAEAVFGRRVLSFR